MERSEKLLCQENSVLVIVDAQEVFLKPIKVRQQIIENIQLLTHIARKLEIPILATTQNAEKLGGLIPEVAETLGDAPIVDKLCFSCMASEPFAQHLQAAGRMQVVLVGVEAHICVMQTAMDLLKAGYTVHVPYDAVASRQKRDWKHALLRLANSGAEISAVESVIYEWLYEAGTDSFREVLPLLKAREQERQKEEEGDEEEEDENAEASATSETDSEE
ncbi:MAG: isochorismatase family protein [Fimbriimonadales bacterium]|nr:MAG: hydrolase [Fimbriimonadales bacterium]